MAYKLFFKFRTLYADQRGSLMLVSLIFLGVVAFSAIYLSSILNNEIKNARFSDNSLISYYVAESALERSLWYLKEAKATDNASLFTDLAAQGPNESSAEASDAERLYDYDTVAVASEDYTVYNIAQLTPAYIDIFDPSIDRGAGGGSTNVSFVNVQWYQESCNGSDQLEINYSPAQIDFNSFTPVAGKTELDVCDCDGTQDTSATDGLYLCGWTSPTNEDSISKIISVVSSNFYRLTMRPLDGDVAKIKVTAQDAGSLDIALPSAITIEARGKYRDSHTKVTAISLWEDVLTGIFNFVIFSEDSLIKNTTAGTSGPLASSCGLCTNGVTACSSSADCGTGTCDNVNSLAFCSLEDDGLNEFDHVPGPITQTNDNECNAQCNGLTFCGDGYRQSIAIGNGPNGSLTGGYSASPGNEECDDGNALNDDSCSEICTQIIHLEMQRGVNYAGLGPYTGVEDTYLNESSPTSNYVASTELIFGRDISGSQGRRHIMLEYNISTVPYNIPAGATIGKATLTLRLFDHTVGSRAIDGYMYRIIRDWLAPAENTNWKNYGNTGGKQWHIAGAIGSNDRETTSYTNTLVADPVNDYDWDITSLVQKCIDMPTPADGICRIQITPFSNTNAQLKKFYSSEHGNPLERPKLTIDYYLN